MKDQVDEQEKEAKFKEFFEKARKGVLKYLAENDGSLPLDKMHEHSLNTYFIQHQRFSQLMESFVDEKLIDYDGATQVSMITEKGKEFIK